MNITITIPVTQFALASAFAAARGCAFDAAIIASTSHPQLTPAAPCRAEAPATEAPAPPREPAPAAGLFADATK